MKLATVLGYLDTTMENKEKLLKALKEQPSVVNNATAGYLHINLKELNNIRDHLRLVECQ